MWQQSAQFGLAAQHLPFSHDSSGLYFGSHSFQSPHELDGGSIEFWSTDLDFADEAIILVKPLDVLMGAHISLNSEAEPFDLKIPWSKNKIHSFIGFLEDTTFSVSSAVRNVEVVENSIHLDSVIHSSFTHCLTICTFCVVVDSLDKGVWCY